MIGFNIEAEILTINGRIDAVVKTEKTIFIIEFKVNQSAEKAILQIKEKSMQINILFQMVNPLTDFHPNLSVLNSSNF